MCIQLYYHAPFIHVCDCTSDQEYFIKLLYLFHVPDDYDTWNMRSIRSINQLYTVLVAKAFTDNENY